MTRIFHTCLLAVMPFVFATCAMAAPADEAKRREAAARLFNSNKGYTDEANQLRDLWASTIERSEPVQLLIHELFPAVTPRERESFLDVIETVNHVGGHKGSLNSSWTDANLEPDYPVPGRTVPAYLLPQNAKGTFASNWVGVVPPRFHRFAESSGADLSSELTSLAQRLFATYRTYCSSLESAALHPGSADDIFKRSIEKQRDSSRIELVQMAGEDAVTRLDKQLGL